MIDGAPISGTITLDARRGRFITKVPKIQKWDRIFIRVTDKKGKTFESVVHVKDRQKQRPIGKGLQLKLFCPHQSSNLLTRSISKPNIRESGFDALTDVVNLINDPENRGTKDPEIVITTPFDETRKDGIRLSEATTNNYIFETVKAEVAFNDIIKKEGNPVEGGGAFQFHYWRLQSLYVHPSDANIDKVAIQVFEQGFRDDGAGGFINTPSFTIKKASILDPSPHLELDAKQETETGTNLLLICDKDSGSYLKDFQRHMGTKDLFRSARQWIVNRNYKKGHLVKDLGLTFECTGDHLSTVPNQPPDTTFWIQRFFLKPALWSSSVTYTIETLVRKSARSYKSLSSGNLNNDPETSPTFWIEVFFVPATDYSPLTKDKAQYWVNAIGGYTQASVANLRAAVIDPNVIIRDDRHPRTWVDTVTTDSVILFLRTDLLINGSPFDGLRVLVNGTALGDFAGNDPNGVSRDNAVIEFRGVFGSGGDWFVFQSSQIDREVYDYRDGFSYTFDPCQGAGSFVDDTAPVATSCKIGSRSTNAWIRGAYEPTNIIGVLLNGTFQVDGSFDCAHPLKHDGGDVIELGNEDIINGQELESATSGVFAVFAPNESQRSYFAGLNFAWPWPRNSNSDPHGAVTIGEKILLNEMDFLNMHQNHLGKRQWFGDDVEDYLPIRGFAFFEYLQDILQILLINNPTGDYSMGLWLADKTDNEIVIDYTHGHNDTTEPHAAPISKQKVYRGLQGFKTVIPAQTIEVLDIFDWRNVVRGGIFTKDSFDNAGRYISAATTAFTIGTTVSRFINTVKLKIGVDAFRMFKPLITTNVRFASKPDRNIEPEKLKATEIISWVQAQGLVDSNQLIFEHERQKFTIKSAGRCNIPFGDPVYYEDAEAVDETTDSLPNTVKLVVDANIYTLSKPARGPGGFTVSRRLVSRVWP